MDHFHEQPLNRKPRVLVAPLDWGLGHATRCVPVIHALLQKGCDVWLAGEGACLALLQTEFPSLPVLSLPGYRVRYARTGMGLFWRMLTQIPKIKASIRTENKWLAQQLREHGFDAVISDNRYGLYHRSIPCIFITHQLLIKTGLGRRSERFLQRLNYRHIDRFSCCWVPDHAGEENLAGVLSHPLQKPAIPVRYVGPLSRIRPTDHSIQKQHLLVLLSGPEPQRTAFEEMIIPAIATYPYTATVLRGLPVEANLVPSSSMIQFYNHLPAAALNEELARADMVIARSGYSTVMDLVRMQKRSLLVPTPGQTEQQYLASYLSAKQYAATLGQSAFTLGNAIDAIRSFSYRPFNLHQDEQALDAAIDALLSMIRH